MAFQRVKVAVYNEGRDYQRSMRIKKLFEPITVGNVELKNRIMMLGVTTGMLNKYRVTEKFINFLAARARGGTGLVVVGSAYPFDLDGVTPRYINIASGVGIWSDEFIPDCVHWQRQSMIMVARLPASS